MIRAVCATIANYSNHEICCTFKGNEHFKQKKFKEAIECYSRSIALSPTAVAYANRAMAYLKIRRQV